jgi:hypothetical protein
MKLFHCLLIALPFTGLASRQQDSVIDKIPGVFAVENSHFYVKPSREIFSGFVSSALDSPNSNYLAFAGDPNANQQIPFISQTDWQEYDLGPDQGIYVYNIARKSNQLVFKYPPAKYRLITLEWVKNTDILLFRLLEGKQKHVYAYNANTTRLLEIPPISDDFYEPQLNYAQNYDSFVYFSYDSQNEDTAVLYILSLQSMKWRKMSVPVRSNLFCDGKIVITYEYNRETKKATFSEVNLLTGRITELTMPEEREIVDLPYFEINLRGPKIIIGEDVSIDEDDSTGETTLPKNFVYLTQDGFNAGYTNDQKTVWYTDRSGLHISEVALIRPSETSLFEKEYTKQLTISQAKQMGVGISIYSSDYDDILPRSSDWADCVMPYVKSEELFQNFKYLLDGQEISKLGDPRQIALGQIETPYGTATVFLDLNVIWKDRPKSTQTQTLTELRY